MSDNGQSTIEVLWANLDAIAAQMKATLIRTAFSASIRDAGDCSCALFDRRGRMITQSSTAPGQLGSVPFLMEEFLRRVPGDTVNPGDVFITNDPWLGCGHTPDIYVISPIFQQRDLLGFAAISGHHSDIGGRLGSHDSREVYEEGLLIPIVHLRSAGRENEELVALLRANSRLPDELIGDLRAQTSGLAVAERRLTYLSRRLGLTGSSIETLTDEILDRSASAVRAAIAAVPDGSYQSMIELDHRDPAGRRLRICATVLVTGESLTVDFTGTSPQVPYPINSVMNYSRAYVFAGVKMALAPGVPSNAGAIAPVTVRAPEATIVNAAHPIAVRWRTTVGLMIPDLILHALADAIPDKAIAGNGTVPRWHEMFYHRSHQGSFIVHCHYMGGMGATSAHDGLSAVAWPANIREIPLEYIESDSPLRAERKEYRVDSGGPGRHRGGLGQEVTFHNPTRWPDGPAYTVMANVNSGRIHEGGAGLRGGHNGARGEVLVDGQPVAHPRGEVPLPPGSSITFRTPGGGGFGPPRQRDAHRLRHDLRTGVVSQQGASHYRPAPDATHGEAP